MALTTHAVLMLNKGSDVIGWQYTLYTFTISSKMKCNCTYCTVRLVHTVSTVKNIDVLFPFFGRGTVSNVRTTKELRVALGTFRCHVALNED